MEEKNFTVEHLTFVIKFECDKLILIVVDKMLCEEYRLVIEKSDKIFNNCSIIKSIQILKNVIIDAFENKNNIVMKYQRKENTTTSDGQDIFTKYFEIEIKLDVIYVKDEIVLKLQYVEKPFTPEQMINRMDEKFEEQKNELKEFGKILVEKCEQRITSTYDEKIKCMQEKLDDMRKMIELLKEENFANVIKYNPLALKYIDEQTPEMCMKAVKQDGNALLYVKEQTPEICMEAVKQDGCALAYVKEQTPEICREAVKHDERAWNYVKKKTPEIWKPIDKRIV